MRTLETSAIDLDQVGHQRSSYPGYKFTTIAVAEAMLTRGSVRIGTASEYRRPDAIKGGRGDPLEMRRVWQPRAGRIPQDQADAFSRGAWSRGDKPWPGPVEIIVDEGVRIITGHRDAYLFCYSRGLTKTLVRRMLTDFGYEACVWIEDVPTFAAHLPAVFPELARFSTANWPAGRFLCASVEYAHVPAVSRDYQDVVWREKDMSFRWQREGRVVWWGNDTLEPIIRDVPVIIPMLKPVDLTAWKKRPPFRP